eukprot:CAMPEP_0184656762 /NCGR_PEP_ID=MMETSP0308-20130426/16734_1 /TAXON_ID=38269 /ORGANISM="Gloeochaete witrockiana, Strain SAG 46.84" /LENGTH=294 /DNA_ID=CAMNT_0027094023 /DNA_START=50 /DNA_END=934 /DNA_ORIENTATION=-
MAPCLVNPEVSSVEGVDMRPPRPKSSGLSKALAEFSNDAKGNGSLPFEFHHQSVYQTPRALEMDQYHAMNMQISHLKAALHDTEVRLAEKESLLKGNVVRSATRIKALEEVVATLRIQMEIKGLEISSLNEEVTVSNERILELEKELELLRLKSASHEPLVRYVYETEDEDEEEEEEEEQEVQELKAENLSDELSHLSDELSQAYRDIKSLQSCPSHTEALSRLKAAEQEIEHLRSEAAVRDELITKLKRLIPLDAGAAAWCEGGSGSLRRTQSALVSGLSGPKHTSRRLVATF